MTATTPPPRIQARRAVGMELLGVLGALVLALTALAHVAGSGRATFLFYDGDSELLPLMRQAILHGGPLHFALSTGLVFPELALYLVCATFATSVQGAIAVNAVVNVLIFYGLVRAIAGQSAPSSSRGRRIGLAIATMGLLTVLMLLESGRDNNDFELFTMNLTGTYYLSTVIGTTATALLTLVAVRRTRGRHVGPAIALVGVAALSVAVSSIYIAWSVVPIVVVLAGLAALRRVHWRTATIPVVAIVVGTVLGFVIRIPLAPFITADGLSYVHLLSYRLSLGSYARSTLSTVTGSPTGFLVIVALVALVVLSILATVRALRRRAPIPILGFSAIAAVSSVVILVGAVLLGQVATRYLLPAAFLPVFMMPAIIVLFRWDHVVATKKKVLARIAVALLAIGVLVAPAAAVGTVRASRYTGSECLDSWLAGRQLVGAGYYWTVRAMNVYDPNVRLLQVLPIATTFAWLIDLDSYRVDAVSYVLVDADDDRAGWGESLTKTFGPPNEIVPCSGYKIYDYVGAVGVPALTRSIVDSAAADRAARGW